MRFWAEGARQEKLKIRELKIKNWGKGKEKLEKRS